MKSMIPARLSNRSPFHFKRSRLNQLFMEAVKYSHVMVCAGAGYGKTSAVYDFVREYKAKTIWLQLSERDNVAARTWENYTNSLAQADPSLAAAIGALGFPDSEDKENHYFSMLYDLLQKERIIMVWDDVHLIENPAIIRFAERAMMNLTPGTSLFLVSRTAPKFNTTALVSKGQLFSINEDDLRFTETELSRYFRMREIKLPSNNLRGIMDDTEGWAFAINLIARSYKKAPGYEGYLRNALRTNIFQLMETEVWSGISLKLQNFLICLSLIDHLSVDLIFILANGDNDLIAELERKNAYIRRDNYTNAYLIHQLFLEFLREKQQFLSEKDKQETYKIAGEWCNKNGFETDALNYYEKLIDYESIVSIFFRLPAQVPQDIALYAAQVFSRIPPKVFDRVDLLAVMHVRTIISLGLWEDAFELIKYYEERFRKMPEDDHFRNRSLGRIYYCWGMMRSLMCTTNDVYDFDEYFAKQNKCLTKSPADLESLSNHPVGAWASLVGSPREGALQEYIEAVQRAAQHASQCLNGAMTVFNDLVMGELKYYQGDIRNAEFFIIQALEHARKCKQFEIVHRALFYTLRIAFAQGNFVKAERALKDMEAQLSETEYSNRYITFDIGRSAYFLLLGLPEKIPDWLKDNISPYGHAYFIENFANQAKARYFYMTKNYPVLLQYMQEQKQREAVLYGRVEMLAMEACIHHKLKNKTEAFIVLNEAYKMAVPNSLIMPFVELNKNMRTLSASALKDPDCPIPADWLETIHRKSATFAKRQAHVVAEYNRTNCPENGISLSTREREVLTDLSHGLSRAEIAANHNLSVNTVKMVIGFIYTKLGAKNLADLIRIAAGRRMI